MALIDDIESVLIVRLSAIGDVIHALPVLDALRRARPDLRIGWIVEELSAPLLDEHPQIDKLYVVPKKRWRGRFLRKYLSEIRPFYAQIKQDGWDAAIDLQGLTKSGLAAWWSGAPVRVGYGDSDGREINKLFTTVKVVPPNTAIHVVERNLALLRGLGIEPDMKAVGTLGFASSERDRIRACLVEAGWNGSDRLLAINPGAGWISKQYPSKHLADAAARLHYDRNWLPLIFWGPREEPLRDQIAEHLKARGVPHLVAPPTSVRELAVLISVCEAYIGGDTGPTHLAGMLGLKTVAVFGASDGARNRPWPVESAALVQRGDLDCVPCWKTRCPLTDDAHMACLRGLDPTRIAEAMPRDDW